MNELEKNDDSTTPASSNKRQQTLGGWSSGKLKTRIIHSPSFCLLSLYFQNVPNTKPKVWPPNSKQPVTSYCWWFRNSCTIWYGKYLIIYKVSYMPGGAGFPPSTIPNQYPPAKTNILDPHTASLDFRKIISCGGWSKCEVFREGYPAWN